MGMVLEKTVANYLADFLKRMDNISLKIYTRKFIREKGRKRRRIQALLYGVLTYLPTIDEIARGIYGEKFDRFNERKRNQIRVYIYRVVYQKIYPHELRKDILLKPILKAKLEFPNDIVKEIALKTSFQEWIVRKLLSYMDAASLEAYLSSLNERQPTWLYVNTLKTSLESVVRKLEIEGVEVNEDKDIPNLLRVISTRKPLDKTMPYYDNEILIMSKASVAVVYTLNPKPGESILDACAAPGMKTLLSSILMENQGKIIAVDTSESRLNRMRKLLKKYEVSIVETVRADARKFRVPIDVDRILIDAPCTSSGMIMESPDIKLRLSPNRVEGFQELQWEILTNMLENINSDTIVTYSTCSIFPEEGELQISRLKEEIGVNIHQVKFGGKPYINSVGKRFYPNIHQTIGMFISKFSRG